MLSVNGINLAISSKNKNGYVAKDYFDTFACLHASLFVPSLGPVSGKTFFKVFWHSSYVTCFAKRPLLSKGIKRASEKENFS